MPNDKVDTEFLFYLLKNNVEILKSNSSGTTFGELSGSRLKALKFAFPKISEQKSISKILSDLDSKIELNHKMNQILEQIAQTVFKSWFVDYEFPDEDGKPYRSSGGEMAYSSEMGKKIPKGWRRRKYSELAEVKTGKSLKPKELVRHGKFPIMGANGELGRTNAFLFNKELILTGRVGTLGRVYIVNGKSWISDNVLISDTKSKDFFYYAYYTLKGFDFISLNRGSTQPLITQTDLKNYPCLIPDKTTLLLFNKISLSIFNKIFSLKIQNKNIAQIRDSLLPKLMSGKIRIPS